MNGRLRTAPTTEVFHTNCLRSDRFLDRRSSDESAQEASTAPLDPPCRGPLRGAFTPRKKDRNGMSMMERRVVGCLWGRARRAAGGAAAAAPPRPGRVPASGWGCVRRARAARGPAGSRVCPRVAAGAASHVAWARPRLRGPPKRGSAGAGCLWVAAIVGGMATYSTFPHRTLSRRQKFDTF